MHPTPDQHSAQSQCKSPTLELKQVVIRNNQRLLCRELNLKLYPGKILGLVGPNGCGKSTLLKTMAGLLAPSSGQISIDNENIHHINPRRRAQLVATLFQDTQFTFAQSVYDYCSAARFSHHSYYYTLTAQDRALIDHAMECCDLNSLRQQSILRLSGGEKRRLQIASVICQASHIYLLDEPTNHLDLPHQIRILSYFKQQRHAVVCMALHDMNLAYQYCDHILFFLPNGEMKHGPTQTLFQPQVLSKLFQHPIAQYVCDGKVFWYPEMLSK